jgi:hypothetical protein
MRISEILLPSHALHIGRRSSSGTGLHASLSWSSVVRFSWSIFLDEKTKALASYLPSYEKAQFDKMDHHLFDSYNQSFS